MSKAKRARFGRGRRQAEHPPIQHPIKQFVMSFIGSVLGKLLVEMALRILSHF
jgi:hypothetical protein